MLVLYYKSADLTPPKCFYKRGGQREEKDIILPRPKLFFHSKNE